MKDKFISQHLYKWHQEGLTMRASLLKKQTALLQASGGTCSLAYTNQYFKPRLNLAGNSFTGIVSATEPMCALLSTFFYDNNCFSYYYTNADPSSTSTGFSNSGTPSGYGMCRCLPTSTSGYSALGLSYGHFYRYSSSSGNNIYSC